ncbi:MAG: hypothetical protein JJV98_03385 [Desulfosarcina sp.]|nr:hypothetical protein [Desulfobacterales bacterium]
MTNKRIWWYLVVAVFFGTAMVAPLSAALLESHENNVARLLESRIKSAVAKERFSCQGELVCGIALIPGFYAARGYQPVWTKTHAILPAASDLLGEIEAVDRYGLIPADYHWQRLRQMTQTLARTFEGTESVDARLRADYDLLMTDAFFLLVSHILGGRVNPESIHPEWETYSHEVDLAPLLNGILV